MPRLERLSVRGRDQRVVRERHPALHRWRQQVVRLREELKLLSRAVALRPAAKGRRRFADGVRRVRLR
eukprot:7376301-Prymnesium_polylepis.1